MSVITDLLGVPADRTDLAMLFSVFAGACLLSLLAIAIQACRKRRPSVLWGVVFFVSLLISVIFVFVGRFNDTPSAAEIEARKAAEAAAGADDESDEPEQVADTSVTFEEIYQAYKENELRADDTYQYNRYRITAVINNIETDGLFNLTGGATLTMEKMVGNTYVFFYAEFEKEQEEALKTVNTGDTITFEGKCLDAGTWTECKLITE